MAILEGRLLEELASLKQQVKLFGYTHVKISSDLLQALAACYDLAIAPVPTADTESTGVAVSRMGDSATINGQLFEVRNGYVISDGRRQGKLTVFTDPTTKGLRVILHGSDGSPVIVSTSFQEFWHTFADYTHYRDLRSSPPLDQQSRLGT